MEASNHQAIGIQHHNIPSINWPPFPAFYPPPPGMLPPPLGSFDPHIPPPFFPSHNFHHGGPPMSFPPMMKFNPFSNYNPDQNQFNVPVNTILNTTNIQPVHNQPANTSFNKNALDDPLEIQIMKKWLDARSNKNDEAKDKKSKWRLSIPEFKNCLRKVMVLDGKLKVTSRCLEDGCHGCECSLDGNVSEDAHRGFIDGAQDEIRSIQSKVDGDAVEEIKSKLRERKKKRDRLKRKKEREKIEEEERMEKRKRLDEEMNEKIARVAEAETAVKKEMEVSKEADGILFEVRRKIADIKKSMKTLALLRKLREIRFNKKSGLLNPSITETFNERVEASFAFLRNQLKIYESEQKTLQVMLNTEHEADREKELKKKNEKMRRQYQKEFEAANRLLFGTELALDPSDPRSPFFHMYDLPNQDINTFVNVRHQWDQYLVPPRTPGASKIPPMWVTPSEPSSELWESCLTSRQTSLHQPSLCQ